MLRLIAVQFFLAQRGVNNLSWNIGGISMLLLCGTLSPAFVARFEAVESFTFEVSSTDT
jgi:hypothetical protein